MPDVKRTYEKYSAKGVFFLGVSDDRDRAVLEKHLEDHGITWPQTLDSAALCKAFGVSKFPAAFVLDRLGENRVGRASNEPGCGTAKSPQREAVNNAASGGERDGEHRPSSLQVPIRI
jgi:hypothetical protein